MTPEKRFEDAFTLLRARCTLRLVKTAIDGLDQRTTEIDSWRRRVEFYLFVFLWLALAAMTWTGVVFSQVSCALLGLAVGCALCWAHYKVLAREARAYRDYIALVYVDAEALTANGQAKDASL